MAGRLPVLVLLSGLMCTVALAGCTAPDQPPAPTRRADGAELLYSPPNAASAQNPAFAPDGASLVFTLFHDGYNKGPSALQLLSLGSRSGTEVLIEDQDRASVNLPGSSWNAATGRITFASDRHGRDEIWTLERGREPVKVTNHDGAAGFTEPSFSPDGAWITFQESDSQDNPTSLGSIWKVRSDGSGLTRLIDGAATGADNRQPNWSPRGDRIVFQRNENGAGWRLFTIAPDGTGLRALTGGNGEDTDASWSADGRWVVYSSTHGGLELSQVFVVGVGGGEPVRVTNAGTAYDGAPSWGPDGKWIAFESHQGGRDAPTALWRIPAPTLG